MGGVDTVEAEVRELVRRRGLDPVEDRSAVRRLVEEVVADYDERTLTSALPPIPDQVLAARAVYDAVAGFGPLQRHLDDTVEEVWINERLTAGSAARPRSDEPGFRTRGHGSRSRLPGCRRAQRGARPKRSIEGQG